MSLSDCQYCKVAGGTEDEKRLPGNKPPSSLVLNSLASLLPPLNWLPASSVYSVSHDLWSGSLNALSSFSSALSLSLLSGTPPQAGISSAGIHF